MRLVESFTSLQGESTHAGRVCHFLRLAGCNLNCSYCDTRYACGAEAGEPATVSTLVEFTLQSGARLVEITGGEPLLTPETPALCQALLDAGCEVLIETNGSLSIAPLPPAVRKIVDCKLPGSGMDEHNLFANYALLQPHDEIKFVISDRRDFKYACRVIEEYELPTRTSRLVMSPVWGRIDFAQLAAWIIDARSPARMQLQMHKLIWGNRPGV